MRAVYYERKGPAREVLSLGDLPDPEPGPSEVRVKVRFSAVNPTDTKARGGWDGSKDMPAMRACLTVHFVLVYVMPREAHWAAARDTNAIIEAGRYRPHVARAYKLEQTAEAHEAQDSGNTVGKLLIGL